MSVPAAELGAWILCFADFFRVIAPQGKPGTKITANPATVQPIFPTSAWTVFKTVGGAPVAATTITASPTYTIVTLPNQATPATFTSN